MTNRSKRSDNKWQKFTTDQGCGQAPGPKAPRIGLFQDLISGLLLIGLLALFTALTRAYVFPLVEGQFALWQKLDDRPTAGALATLAVWFAAWGLAALMAGIWTTYRSFRRQRLLVEIRKLVYTHYEIDYWLVAQATSTMPTFPRPALSWRGPFAYTLASSLDWFGRKTEGLVIVVPRKAGNPILAVLKTKTRCVCCGEESLEQAALKLRTSQLAGQPGLAPAPGGAPVPASELAPGPGPGNIDTEAGQRACPNAGATSPQHSDETAL